MNETELKSGAVVDAVLEGGPSDMPLAARCCQANADKDRIKVPHRGGYEHFQRTDERTGGDHEPQSVVYQWVGRTKIAE